MAFDGLVISNLVYELNQTILNAKISFFNKTGATPPSPVRPSGAPSLTKAVSPAGGSDQLPGPG